MPDTLIGRTFGHEFAGTVEEGGWPVVAPSPIPFNPSEPASIALDKAGTGDPRRARLPAASVPVAAQ